MKEEENEKKEEEEEELGVEQDNNKVTNGVFLFSVRVYHCAVRMCSQYIGTFDRLKVSISHMH